MSKRAPAPPPQLTDFEYRELLGSGGFADVYLYQQLKPRREVAVKVLLAEGLTDEGRRQFAAEADLMAMLSAHPAIVTIYDADIARDGRPYLVMEYYPGPNMSARLRGGSLSVPDVLQVGVQIAAAIETAHRAGIIHRDIKPANILTSRYQRPGLTDFGISASTHDSASDEQSALSVPWAPPEAFGEGAADERGDIYSLAATIHTMLTGRSPFELVGGPNSALDLMTRIDRDPVPRTGRADVPPDLERLLAQGMAKSPEARPESALAVARALQQIEIDMRFQPTAIDVLEDLAPTQAPDRTPETPDATRVRGVVTVNPDREPQARLDATRSVSDATTVRDGVENSATIRRTSPSPTSDGDIGAADEHQTRPAPRSRTGLIIGLAAAAAVAVAVVLLILRPWAGANDVALPQDAPPTIAEPAPTDVLTSRPDEPVDVVVIAGPAGGARVTWTNPDPQAGDAYAWWRTDPGADSTPQTTTETTAEFTASVDEVPCVVVVTIRDGVASRETRPACLEGGDG